MLSVDECWNWGIFILKYFTLLKHKENNSKEQHVNSESGSYSADQYSPYIDNIDIFVTLQLVCHPVAIVQYISTQITHRTTHNKK